MINRLKLALPLFMLVACNSMAQEVEPKQSKQLAPKNAPFVPPKDAVIANTIEISGKNKIHRIRLERLVASKERTISIPLKNSTDEELEIVDISVKHGYLTAITNHTALQPNKPTYLYLRASPTTIGNFINSATITLSNQSKVKLVIEAKVETAFSIVPSSVVLTPGDTQGKLITITSHFGEQAFSVKSQEPLVEVVEMKRNGAELTAKCVIAKDADESMVPVSLQVPLVISGVRDSHEYTFSVNNANRIDVKPAFMIAGRRGVNKYRFIVIVTSYVDIENVVCSLPKTASHLSVHLVKSQTSGNTSFNEYDIEGDVNDQESVLINWSRGGKTLATTEVFFDRNSAIAAKRMQEARAKFNADLIEAGTADAISDF